MKRFKIINSIFGLLFIALTTISNYAQEPKELYVRAYQRAARAMHDGDIDAAIKFYTQAINIWEKIEAFTSKNEKIKVADGRCLETTYTSLEPVHFGRAKAYLQKGNLEAAEEDYMFSLIFTKNKIVKNLDEANKNRDCADINKEKKPGFDNTGNSFLMRAASIFNYVLHLTNPERWLTFKNEEYKTILRMKTSTQNRIFSLFDEIIKHHEEAHFGKTEAYVASMSKAGNKANNFEALNSANNYVVAFPESIRAYRLRAKIYRHLGYEQAALADEQKAGELSGQK